MVKIVSEPIDADSFQVLTPVMGEITSPQGKGAEDKTHGHSLLTPLMHPGLLSIFSLFIFFQINPLPLLETPLL